MDERTLYDLDLFTLNFVANHLDKMRNPNTPLTHENSLNVGIDIGVERSGTLVRDFIHLKEEAEEKERKIQERMRASDTFYGMMIEEAQADLVLEALKAHHGDGE